MAKFHLGAHFDVVVVRFLIAFLESQCNFLLPNQ